MMSQKWENKRMKRREKKAGEIRPTSTEAPNFKGFPLLVQGSGGAVARKCPLSPPVFFFRIALAIVGLWVASCGGPIVAPDYSPVQEQAATVAGAGVVELVASSDRETWQASQVKIAETKAWLETQRIIAEARSRSRNWVGFKQWGEVEKMFWRVCQQWEKRGTNSPEFARVSASQLKAAFDAISRTEAIRNRNR